MKLAAITGSIGCGKTTLAGLVRELGYVVYDIDGWTRALYRKPAFIRMILENFPSVGDKGKVNKRKLRDLVFNDNRELKRLEGLVHPFLEERFFEMIRRNSRYDDVFFIDAALIFELGWDRYCDLVVVADVDYELQKQRVMKRDGITAADFEKIVAVQMSNREKILRADVIVETDKPLGVLKVELLSIIDEL
jgi:dephospho-coA kinase